jgi:hypothetical protein
MNEAKRYRLSTLCLTLVLTACGSDIQDTADQALVFAGANDAPPPNQQLPPDTGIIEVRERPNPERNAYFGDLHVHTAYSFDAFSFGTTASPYDAYRFAMGEEIQHPSGYSIQLSEPLDFYAVTDHAMFLGVVKAAADTDSEFSRLDVASGVHNMNAPDNMGDASLPQRVASFATFLPRTLAGLQDGSIDASLVQQITRAAWRDTVDAAERFNTPGRFTTFVAYEYTSSTDARGNLHRNVIFRGGAELPAAPFSRFNSQNPEGLWDWMDGLRERGIESLAIPHNSNGSDGAMFMLRDWAGQPIDNDYATQRLRNEPLVEITQVKGTSDTHPLLSKNDEWADFEIMPYKVATTDPSQPPGSYVRDAYLRGMGLQAEGVVNPYRFGLVAASDTHVAATSDSEETFFSKAGILDGTAVARGSVPMSFLRSMVVKFTAPEMIKEVDGKEYMASSSFETWSASGIAGVWAEENTREAIYDAFRRKETFATTGPRIRVRFFAGLDYTDDLTGSADMLSTAYAGGVPMGGELRGDGRSPGFLVWAAKDGDGAALQRLQVIKGYVKDGEHVENVYDVACSDGLQPDGGHRCPDNGATVNLDDCSFTPGKGAAELKTLWRDPDFDPQQEAFYYVRVLENPTCRWSTWDAVRAGTEPRPDLQATIQERAWASPIWYSPPE